MSDIISLFIIGGELVFLAYSITWFAKELREWKKQN